MPARNAAGRIRIYMKTVFDTWLISTFRNLPQRPPRLSGEQEVMSWVGDLSSRALMPASDQPDHSTFVSAKTHDYPIRLFPE